MKKVQIIPFKAEHVSQFDDAEGELIYVGADFDKQMFVNEDNGPGYTGVYDDKIIGCGGVTVFWAGFGEAWGIYPRSTFFHFVREVYYYTKKGLNEIMDHYELRRVQASARCDYPCAQNWLRHLGFNIEARMKNYCPSGSDAYLYSIIRNT